MVSTFGIIPWSRLHSRNLQWLLLPHQRAGRSNSLSHLHLPPSVVSSLRWWTSEAISRGTCFREPCRLVLMTDASLSGWGAHLQQHMEQGQWSAWDRLHNINVLELRAVRLALVRFHSLVEGKDILVLTDNMSTKAHINKLGGTHSRMLLAETVLSRWAEAHLSSIRADHISGTVNVQADALSRSLLDYGEWSVSPLFQDIVSRFGNPVLDLSAIAQNHQLPRYFSRFPDPQDEATNALRSTWSPGLLYAFPPLPLIP